MIRGTTLGAALVTLAVAAVGCTSDDVGLDAGVVPDAGQPVPDAATPRDAEATDALPDAAMTDALPTDLGTEPDAGAPLADAGLPPEDAGVPTDAGAPPARRLVERKLFGAMPLDNAVLNPQFDPSSGNWYAFGDLADGPRFVRTTVRTHARTPVGLPSMLLQARSNDPPDATLLGSVMPVPGPIAASVWIGRESADAARLADARASLVLTLATGGREVAYDLLPETTTATVGHGTIVWQRYSATIGAEAVGLGTFQVTDPAFRPLYVHAPTVVSVRTFAPRAARLHRALTERELRALAAVARERRRDLADPSR